MFPVHILMYPVHILVYHVHILVVSRAHIFTPRTYTYVSTSLVITLITANSKGSFVRLSQGKQDPLITVH